MKLKIEEILERINKLDFDELFYFISHLDLTLKQMNILIKQTDKYVRRGLSENPKITEKVMIKLARDEDDFVRYGLAKNPNLTEELMIKLANDEDVRKGLAQNPNLTEKVMIKLANDKERSVRWELAANPKITEKLMIQLSSDTDEYVSNKAFEKLQSLNSLKKEELESAYDLIMKSKYIKKYRFKVTFNYIADKFPELSELAKMFKKLILKLKKDLK